MNNEFGGVEEVRRLLSRGESDAERVEELSDAQIADSQIKEKLHEYLDEGRIVFSAGAQPISHLDEEELDQLVVMSPRTRGVPATLYKRDPADLDSYNGDLRELQEELPEDYFSKNPVLYFEDFMGNLLGWRTSVEADRFNDIEEYEEEARRLARDITEVANDKSGIPFDAIVINQALTENGAQPAEFETQQRSNDYGADGMDVVADRIYTEFTNELTSHGWIIESQRHTSGERATAYVTRK